MENLILIILATAIISLLSFIGALALFFKERLLQKILLSLVALSAGALLGGAFLHLIPESLEKTTNTFLYLLIGFVIFFIIERFLHWRHCHKDHCPIHTFAYMNLFGESIHNFIDGLIIAAAFIADIKVGIATTIAVALHEIPQELGDFGVLIHGGFKKGKALLLNFLVGLTAIIGGILGFYLINYSQTASLFLIPFAAGGFIYIAASDLVPELRKETKFSTTILTLITFILGILIMYLAKIGLG